MSSRAGKMEKQVLKQSMPEQKTKTAQYRVDVHLDGIGRKTTYVTVTGIPEDLPEEYENTILRSAEMQFINAINERTFIEFYNEGKSVKEEQPVFFNIKTFKSIQVVSVTKIA